MSYPINLKPCPFCGSQVAFNHNLDLEPDGIYCGNCRTIMRFLRIRVKSDEAMGVVMGKMAEAWNRRAGEVE